MDKPVNQYFEVIAEVLNMSIEQVVELAGAIDQLRGKFGSVRMDFKNGKLHRIGHTIEGKPYFVKEKDGE